ncbi:hypothetical protein Tco_0204515 [Tanacetum coccineum]
MSQPANDEFSQHLSDDEESNHEDASDAAPKQKQQAIPQSTTAISNIKLPILKKEEYDIWAMEMEHYLEYIDIDVWKERKARTILLMAIPKEHLRRFHGMDDAKEIWEAIRTRRVRKGIMTDSNNYLQLEAHGAEVSNEDAIISFSDLAPSMEIHRLPQKTFQCSNVAFLFHKSKASTNKVKSGFTGAYSTFTPSTFSTNISKKEVLAGFADEVIYSLFAKQSEDWDLLHEDLE